MDHRTPGLSPEPGASALLHCDGLAPRPLFPRRVAHPWSQPPLPFDPAASAPAPGSAPPPSVERLVASVAAALIETITGRRATHQLGDRVTEEVSAVVTALARTQRGSNLRLRSVRVQMPRPDRIEAAVHLTNAGRSQAAALQLSRDGDHWQVTSLEIVLDRLRAPAKVA